MSSEELKWEDGIIGKLEKHWERFPISKLFRRGMATVFVSLLTPKLKITNMLGAVKTRIYVVAIDDVGAYKSPPLFALRRLIVRYSRELLAPAKFTVPGFVEHVCGRKQQKDKEAIKAHPMGVIIRDELSKINAEKKQSGFDAIFAFLCELWDGWIEASKTRTYGYEGGVEGHYSLIGTSNYHFLKTLDDDFWLIGLGARCLFVTEIMKRKGMWDDNFFFPTWDEEEAKVFGEVIEMAKTFINSFVKRIEIEMDADELWRKYEYQCVEELKQEKDDVIRTLITKKAQNVLKLAIPYAVSVMNFSKHSTHGYNILHITGDEIQRAIDDVEEYFKCAKKLVHKWKSKQKERESEREKSSKYDLIDFMVWTATTGQGYCSPTEIKAEFFLSNSTKVKEKLMIGVDKNPPWLEKVVSMGRLKEYVKTGKFPKDLEKRFQPKHGVSPAIFRITEEGRKQVGY